ncbi:MAG: FkbM family methyltransferase [Phycisphaerae bacterium]|nr:FkbM family methyltransferase [Phycisphaerae bacterium]
MSMRSLLRGAVRRICRGRPRVQWMLHGILIEATDPRDFRFLAESIADGVRRDLDEELAAPTPSVSIVWSMLWEGARLGRFGARCPKRAVFRFADREFEMELDLAESPECGYLFRHPAPPIARLVREGGRTMLDVGANAGLHALCGRSTFARVHAFEPNPTTAARLVRNISMSGAEEHVRVHRVALSDRSGTASISVERGHSGASRLGADSPQDSVAVPLDTLDAVADREGFVEVDLVKIDVEGHEAAVVRGGRRLLARDRPRIVVELGDIDRFRAFRALLPDGYRTFVPRGHEPPRPLSSEGDARRFRDLLFVPEERVVAVG